VRFGTGANRFGELTGEEIEIEEAFFDKKSLYYHVTYRPKGSENPFDLFTIRLLAKDELDAAKQVLDASRKRRQRT
jgi:hypothetical protein